MIGMKLRLGGSWCLRLDIAEPVVRLAVRDPVDSVPAEERPADDVAAVEDPQLQQSYPR